MPPKPKLKPADWARIIEREDARGLRKVLANAGPNGVNARFQDPVKSRKTAPLCDHITPLYHAARMGSIKMVELLLQHPSLDTTIGCGRAEANALHIASSKGHADVVKMLLDWSKANDSELSALVNLKDGRGKNALHRAGKNAHPDVVRVILALEEDFKVDVNAVETEDGQTALHIAVEGALRSAKGKGKGQRSSSGSEGALQVLEALLDDRRVNVNVHNGSGDTPLHIASRYEDSKGKYKVLEMLLRHPGVEVDRIDDYGRSALFDSSDADTASLLLAHGADPNHISIDHDVPLEVHVSHGKREVVEVLLHHGANPLSLPPPDSLYIAGGAEGQTPTQPEAKAQASYSRADVLLGRLSKRALIEQYIMGVWEGGVPSLTNHCIWRLKRVRSSLDEEQFVEVVPDAIVYEHFRDWRGAKRWIVAWLERDLAFVRSELAMPITKRRLLQRADLMDYADRLVKDIERGKKMCGD